MSMAFTKEKSLVTAIQREIRRKYPLAWIFKVVGHPYQSPGVPDLLVCAGGVLVGIEVKLPHQGESLAHARSRVSAEQLAQLGAISEAGGVSGVVTDVSGALDLVHTAVLQSEHPESRAEGSVPRGQPAPLS